MCIGLNYHVLIITRLIFTNPIKYDVYLVYFICINSHVISKQLTRNNACHGGVSDSALACGACKSCQRPEFESRVKRASKFKKSRTAVSTTERHFTFSVVCLIVECTKDSIRVTKKNIQLVVGRLGWKWIERSALQLLLLKQKEVELLLTITLLLASGNSMF